MSSKLLTQSSDGILQQTDDFILLNRAAETWHITQENEWGIILEDSSGYLVTQFSFNSPFPSYFRDPSLIIDFYPESNQDDMSGVSVIEPSYVGQSFYNSFDCTLDSVKFSLGKHNSPTGYATAKIYAMTGTYGSTSVPTGSALATSDNFDVSTLTSGTTISCLRLINFTFSGANKISLTAGTHYCVEVNFSGGDAFNALWVGVDTTSPTHSGNYNSYHTSLSWTAVSGYDNIFYVYGHI